MPRLLLEIDHWKSSNEKAQRKAGPGCGYENDWSAWHQIDFAI
jgi:hypothetical protein